MRTPGFIRSLIGTAATLFFILSPVPSMAQPQTLCVIDLNRIGEDSGQDWLRRGLADMLITALNATSEFQIVDRSQLSKLMDANSLGTTGLTEPTAALNLAQLTKAQLLLLGNFTLENDQISIELRLLRAADQEITSTSKWHGALPELSSGIRELTGQLLTNNGHPFDPARWQGMEKYFPQRIDVAETYYRGLNEFDAGHYPEALAFFINGAEKTDTFLPVFDRMIETYHLLDEPAQSMAAALQTAEKFQTQDLGTAMNYYFQASDKAGRSDELTPVRRRILERMISLAESHETRTKEAAATKSFVSEKIWEEFNKQLRKPNHQWLTIWHWNVLRIEPVFWRMWIMVIDDQLGRRYDQVDTNGTQDESGTWVQKPIPPLTVWMWKTRAQVELARLYAAAKMPDKSIATYHDILNDYNFTELLAQRSQTIKKDPFSSRFDFYAAVIREAQDLILRSAVQTGRLVPDPLVFPKLNFVENHGSFRRNFSNYLPDPRTNIWGNDPDTFTEEYSFVAPPGYQIDRVRLKSDVNGLEELLYLSNWCNLRTHHHQY